MVSGASVAAPNAGAGTTLAVKGNRTWASAANPLQTGGVSSGNARGHSISSVNFEVDVCIVGSASYYPEGASHMDIPGLIQQPPRPSHSNRQQPVINQQYDIPMDTTMSSNDFEYRSPDRHNRDNKSRRTLTSMATSFTPEPWQLNPQIEKTLGAGVPYYAPEGPTLVGPPHAKGATARVSDSGNRVAPARYLRPRTTPERLPGWWKAWISALAFTMTTPTGIIIGLALRHIYEPNSVYALLLNGVLQSICTGVLVYAGLVTLMINGFSSVQVKQQSRLRQVMLFFAVYAGAAVMAGLKIWK
ncbi:low-affinity Zn(2+) transporter zrt2 [Coemansia sp. Benny D115]|nr:low-affinity Zn(2+) transporter zrt2 [Coemansia sp. Benny D115]